MAVLWHLQAISILNACWLASSIFRYVLTDIFNMMDTDMNGLLSRDEFNQYSIRTGEDEIGDDEWDIVKG